MSFPDYVTVIFNGRQTGKTTLVMDEAYSFALERRTAEILIIMSSARAVDSWRRQWRDKYPALLCPHVISIQNTLSARGRRFEKIYIEDIDHDLEGIYSERVMQVWPCLAHAREPELVFTCSPLDIMFPDWDEVERLEEEKRQRELEVLKDSMMLAYMRNKIAQWRKMKDEG